MEAACAGRGVERQEGCNGPPTNGKLRASAHGLTQLLQRVLTPVTLQRTVPRRGQGAAEQATPALVRTAEHVGRWPARVAVQQAADGRASRPSLR